MIKPVNLLNPKGITVSGKQRRTMIRKYKRDAIKRRYEQSKYERRCMNALSRTINDLLKIWKRIVANKKAA